MNDDTHGDLNAILSDPGALVTGEPPLVLATNFELVRVLEGHELAFTADDSTRVRVRLYTVDELLKAQRAAALTLEAETDAPGPGMTREKATGLCMPLSVLLARKGWKRP